MFVVDKTTLFIDPAGKKILSLLRSSNQPLLAAADRPAEPTEAFICSFQNKKKRIETYLMLNLIKSNIRVFYKSDKGEYDPSIYTEVEADSLEFLESMGFMMDSVEFQKISETEREELFGSLPIFVDDRKTILPQAEEEMEYVSAAELKEALEDVIGAEDLERVDSPAGEAKPSLSLDSLDELSKPVGKSFADRKEEQVIPPPAEDERPHLGAKQSDERLARIARLISSF